MSILVDNLRDSRMHHLCGQAADEIEDLERAYELLFKEAGELRREAEQAKAMIEECRAAMRSIAVQEGHWCTHCMGVGPESCMNNQPRTAVAHSGVPAHAACFFKDGDAWCCVRGDFLNLQESPAGFGSDMEEALNALSVDVGAA